MNNGQRTSDGFAARLFHRFGPRYILVMMILTRLFGSVGGLLVIYYVELTLELPSQIRHDFRVSSAIVVVLSCTLTVLLAQWETRSLRDVLRRLRSRQPVAPDLAARAGREAVIFVGRHHWHEAWLVPCSTLVPVLIYLKVCDDASATILTNITLAVFMGISIALMSTFFAVEHCMQPVILWLLDNGLPIAYDSLPVGRLRFRFGLCSTLIIMTTALMIGTLARQRAADIATDPTQQAQAVADLQKHSTYITIAAVIVGVAYSTVLAKSVASRVANLVDAMDHVAAGQLSERVRPTGNDEIDILARQFNRMVQQLEHNHHTIRDLNANLEQKVAHRTEQLQTTVQQLRDTQTQLTDLAHRAGMAEVATGVLHNVGNVLNSVNVSTTLVTDRLRKSRLEDLGQLAQQLAQHRDDLAAFLSVEGRTDKLLDYLGKLSSRLLAERDEALNELNFLTEKIGHIKGIITAQQNYARRVSFREQVDLTGLVREVLSLHKESLDRHGVEVRLHLDDQTPPAHLEKTKLVQVLDNLVKNAIDSMVEQPDAPRILTARMEPCGPDRVRIVIADTGRGIRPEHLKLIFSYGFTTKKTGNGFGLHSSALAISALGGTIGVASEGEGRGARFTLEFPFAQETETDGSSPANEPAELVCAHS